MPTVVYLHGFLSSPASKKAQLTRSWLKLHKPEWQFFCPELPSAPQQTKAVLDQLFSRPDLQSDVALIGSSLGGFWATYLCEQKNFPTVLVNPAVSPQKRFRKYLGQPLKHYYSEEVCVLDERDFEVLVQCDQQPIVNTDAYWLMAQKGDDVLDYRLAVERYQGCRQSIDGGGSHEFDGFDSWLPDIMFFFEESTAGHFH